MDAAYIAKLSKADIVYSCGVLHYTGSMWLAIENSINRVDKNGDGYFLVAIYND